MLKLHDILDLNLDGLRGANGADAGAEDIWGKVEESISSDLLGIPSVVWTMKRKEDGEPIA